MPHEFFGDVGAQQIDVQMGVTVLSLAGRDQQITCPVRDLLEQALGIGHAHCFATVVLADHKRAALGIGKVAHPTQILVAPALLPLDGLVLVHGWCLLAST
jgi:hypothetical protein